MKKVSAVKDREEQNITLSGIRQFIEKEITRYSSYIFSFLFSSPVISSLLPLEYHHQRQDCLLYGTVEGEFGRKCKMGFFSKTLLARGSRESLRYDYRLWRGRFFWERMKPSCERNPPDEGMTYYHNTKQPQVSCLPFSSHLVSYYVWVLSFPAKVDTVLRVFDNDSFFPELWETRNWWRVKKKTEKGNSRKF